MKMEKDSLPQERFCFDNVLVDDKMLKYIGQCVKISLHYSLNKWSFM